MNKSQEKFIDLLNQIDEISINYKHYKIEDRGGLYTTYQSFTSKDPNNFLDVGLNVTRKKSNNQMILVQIPYKIHQDFFMIVINLLDFNIERFEIINNETELKSLGNLSLEEINYYLNGFISFFNNVLNTLCSY